MMKSVSHEVRGRAELLVWQKLNSKHFLAAELLKIKMPIVEVVWEQFGRMVKGEILDETS